MMKSRSHSHHQLRRCSKQFSTTRTQSKHSSSSHTSNNNNSRTCISLIRVINQRDSSIMTIRIRTMDTGRVSSTSISKINMGNISSSRGIRIKTTIRIRTTISKGNTSRDKIKIRITILCSSRIIIRNKINSRTVNRVSIQNNNIRTKCNLPNHNRLSHFIINSHSP